jgi:hypothetical protein
MLLQKTEAVLSIASNAESVSIRKSVILEAAHAGDHHNPAAATVLTLGYGVPEPGRQMSPRQMLETERNSGTAGETNECPSSRN